MGQKRVKPVPKGFHSVTPHIVVKSGAAYIDFLKRAFDAEVIAQMPGPGGRLMHAEVRVGDSILMLAEDFPEYGQPPVVEGRWPVVLHLYVPDVDATYARALAAGAQAGMPVSDQFWGDRYGQVKDPSGFTWAICTHKEDVTEEEMQKRAAALFANCGK